MRQKLHRTEARGRACAVHLLGLMVLALAVSVRADESARPPGAPPVPADPLAAAAYRVLEARCAACHQNGLPTTPAPGGFAAVLDLAALAGDRVRIEPGNPLASPLFAVLARTDHHPSAPFDKTARPSADDILAVYDWIASLPSPTTARAEPQTGPTVTTDRARYGLGDTVRFVLRSSESCHWTLIGIRDGAATVLFPNAFERNTFTEGGKTITVPGDKAVYRFRFTETGSEAFAGFCGPNSDPTLGITHRYGRQKFTFLGDWRTFLARRLGGGATHNAPGDHAAARSPAARQDSLAVAPRTAIVLSIPN